MDLRGNTQLFIDGNFMTLTLAQYQAGTIEYNFAYFESVEGLNATLRIYFDPRYIVTEDATRQSQTYNFVVQS